MGESQRGRVGVERWHAWVWPALATGYGRSPGPPIAARALDYEAELAIVIGATPRGVDRATAAERIVGVMAFNDLSARDLQMESSQWFYGKGGDGFAPCGPALVTVDDVGDLTALRLTTTVKR